MKDRTKAARDYCRQNRERFLKDLCDLVAVPSISTTASHSGYVREAADWLAARLRQLGFGEVAVMPTGGHPVVVGELTGPRNAPTVLLYGHYDVQPVDPVDLWSSEPFTAEVRGDHVYGRGTTDMKGQILAALHALEATCAQGDAPLTVRVAFEGEEEIGSPHFASFVEKHKDLLEADFCLNPDCGMLAEDVPTITYSLRGLAYLEIVITGPSKDLHSGVYGGTVHNPAEVLARLLGGLHDERGRVTLPGFYNAVRPLEDDERQELARLPAGEEQYLQQTGAPRLWGEEGYTPVERTGGRPSLDVNGMLSGFTGEGSKTVLPAKAMAKVSMRLVADQDPEQVQKQMERYLAVHTPETVRWELRSHAAAHPSITDRRLPAVAAMSRSLSAIWNKRPVYARSGGTVAVVSDLQRILGQESLLIGFSLPDDDMHSPNERLHLPTWHRGTEALAHFFLSLAD
jgi:acetylornithine deacetylase/succinyl-diaminopimelate desuccinylase-like protein